MLDGRQDLFYIELRTGRTERQGSTAAARQAVEFRTLLLSAGSTYKSNLIEKVLIGVWSLIQRFLFYTHFIRRVESSSIDRQIDSIISTAL